LTLLDKNLAQKLEELAEA